MTEQDNDQPLQPATDNVDGGIVVPEEPLNRIEVANLSPDLMPHLVVEGFRRATEQHPEDISRDPDTNLLRISPAGSRRILIECGLKVAESVRNGDSEESPRDRQFKLFADQLADDIDFDADKIKLFGNIFGIANLDVVLAAAAENKGRFIPVDQVRGMMSDLVGDFIIEGGKIKFSDLPEVVELVGDAKVQTLLTDGLKDELVKRYNLTKSQQTDKSDRQIVDEIIGTMRSAIQPAESEALDYVVEKVEAYFGAALSLEVPPEKIVPELSEGRSFPDLNQRVNMLETVSKQRMLIADDPGMGKSAAAILLKEAKGVKTAVITMPKEVFHNGSWQNYLSSNRDTKHGQARGYFQPGMSPMEEGRVLEVTSKHDLPRALREGSAYDYILIPHSQITRGNCKALKQLGFDMLVVDEAHFFKNIADGIRSNELMELTDQISGDDEYLMLLTATPAPNKVEDIALMLKLLNPGEILRVDGKPATHRELINGIINGNLPRIRQLLLEKMQMKKIEDTKLVEAFEEEVITDIALSDFERELYDVQQENDELGFSEKVHNLRAIVLNPNAVRVTPGVVESAKLLRVIQELNKSFAESDKIVMFVNGPIEDIIRGEMTIKPDIERALRYSPKDIRVEVYHGMMNEKDRSTIREDFQSKDQPMLLIISGPTVSVGIDLAAADEVFLYDLPWNIPTKVQQIGRSHRPGRSGQLKVKSFITPGTIEAGMDIYIQAKFTAINKLLLGIPLSEQEQELIRIAEEKGDEAAFVRPELAQFYVDPIRRLESQVLKNATEVGETKFREFLSEGGSEYASTYKMLMYRSYQANCSRLAGTIVSQLLRARRGPAAAQEPVILDVGSGPEMLRRHLPEALQPHVISLDINPDHFIEAQGQTRVATMTETGQPDKSVDMAVMSLVFDQTQWLSSVDESKYPDRFERAKVLIELNRILKTNGRAVMVMPYTRNFGYLGALKEVAPLFGFSLDSDFSGRVSSETKFSAQLVTLRKTKDISQSLEPIIKELKKGGSSRLGFDRNKRVKGDTKKFVDKYVLNADSGERITVEPELNEIDKTILTEEKEILSVMARLRRKYGKIHLIPDEEILAIEGLARYRPARARNFLLFKYLKTAEGAVIYRGD